MRRDRRPNFSALDAAGSAAGNAPSDRTRPVGARGSLFKRGLMLSYCAAFAIYSVYVWTAGTELPRSLPADPQVAAGFALFQEKNCVACHQFYGLGGHMGPDLTNVISAPDKGADHARAFIESGTAKMPDYGLDAAEVDALLRFLAFVDSSGAYAPRQAAINWTGTVAYDIPRDAR